MTVKELVKALTGLKQDADVEVYDERMDESRRLALVVDEDKDVIICGISGLPAGVRYWNGPVVIATDEPCN